MEELDLVRAIFDKENIKVVNIKKTTSGFLNIVYIVDDYVIKIYDKVEKLNKEVSIYQNVKLDCLPKYIASGNIDNFYYIIISRINGGGLFSIWHNLSNSERENCVKQIVDILKRFNKFNADFLDESQRKADWKSFVLTKFERNKVALQKMGISTKELKIDESIFNENKFGLTYNDVHFDNFLYNNGKLYLIDFDRVIYASIDYELLILKVMCDDPVKYASEEDEKIVFNEDFKDVFNWFKKYYSELFEVPHIDERLKVYQFNYLCDQAVHLKNQDEAKKRAKQLVQQFINKKKL